MYDLQELFTERKVARTLAALLPDRSFEGVHWDRWSVVMDAAGVATQVRTTTKLYPDDPDVAAYTAIPEYAFDPSRPDLAAKYGLIWVRMSDVHPLATSDEYIGCLWAGTKTLFCRITSSAVKRQIRRFDGPDENAYTVLGLAIFNHFDTLEWTRWASDISRAARDNVNYSLIHRTCEDRGLLMTFGTATHHPVRDREALAILGVFGKKDDYERRQKLTGTNVQKAKDGGAPRSENQMAHGYRHARHPGTDRRVKDATRGFMPEAIWEFVPTLQALVHAAVQTDESGRYVTSWREFTRLLAVHDVPRRGQVADGSYRSMFGDADVNDPQSVAAADDLDGDALYRVGRSFFINNNHHPRLPADRAAEPDLTLEERLYLHKVLLWKTGTFLYIRENDIRGRHAEAKGERPVFRGPMDEFGYFHIESRWGFPVDPTTGEELIGWGIPDAVWDKLIDRLLHETRPRRPRGGRSHATQRRRFLEDFGTWTTDGSGRVLAAANDEPREDAVEWTVGARQNNTRGDHPGRQNIVLLARPWPSGTTTSGRRRGWSREQSNPTRHVKGTANLAELAADLRTRLSHAVQQILDATELAPVSLPARRPERDTAADKIASLRAKHATAEREREAARTAAAALREAAARFLTDGNSTKFAQYDQQADDSEATAEHTTATMDALAAQINALTELAGQCPQEALAEADLSVTAYLDEALRRAALNNGDAPWQAADVATRTFSQWKFTPTGEHIDYQCVASLPLADGGTVDVPLAGRVANIRSRTKRTGTGPSVIVPAFFAAGRELDDLTVVHQCTRRSLVINHLMPWLAQQGVTDRAVKCALIDHPIVDVRQLVHAALTGATDPTHARWSAGWREVILETYLHHPTQWGFAACPDDTPVIQQLANTLALAQHREQGLPVAVLAALTGMNAKTKIRRLVKPDDRAASGLGFTRPQYFEYTPGTDKQHVRVRPCPHRGCTGVADRVLLLPEVAVSGWGVLCSSCWRAPVTAEDRCAVADQERQARWARAPFPAAYDTYVTGNPGPAGSLRDGAQSRRVTPRSPFDVASVQPRDR